MVSYVSQPEGLTVPPKQLTYAEIAADLRQRIADGEYPPGSELPSYRELAKLYSCSVSTITRALSLLRHDGIAVGEQGRGVFVADVVE